MLFCNIIELISLNHQSLSSVCIGIVLVFLSIYNEHLWSENEWLIILNIYSSFTDPLSIIGCEFFDIPFKITDDLLLPNWRESHRELLCIIEITQWEFFSSCIIYYKANSRTWSMRSSSIFISMYNEWSYFFIWKYFFDSNSMPPVTCINTWFSIHRCCSHSLYSKLFFWGIKSRESFLDFFVESFWDRLRESLWNTNSSKRSIRIGIFRSIRRKEKTNKYKNK